MLNSAGACTGDGEDRAGRDHRAGPEADQQLVHQPEEAALEADIGGHAVRDDGGRLPRPAGRRGAVHGQDRHGGRHVPAGVVTRGGVCLASVGTSSKVADASCGYCVLWNGSDMVKA